MKGKDELEGTRSTFTPWLRDFEHQGENCLGGVVVTPWLSYPRPRGVLSGKVGMGMCGPDRVLFRALRFCNGPFFI